MHRILIKKISVCFAGIILLISLCACKTDAPYLVKDYLNDLALNSGIGINEDHEENFDRLCRWGVVYESDVSLLDKKTDYGYLSRTIARLIDRQGDSMTVLKTLGYIPESVKLREKVDRKTALNVIEKAVKFINQRDYESEYHSRYISDVKEEGEDLKANDLLYKDGGYYIVTQADEEGYEVRKAEYDEVFESLDLQTSATVDFSEAEVIPCGEIYEDTSYINENYTLLSSSSHVFHSEGFRISYTLSSSGIDFHISKNENGLNIYLDVSIHNVKPRLKWHSEKNDLKNCFFTLSFNTTQKLGVSTGKYRNYRIQFKDLDSSSFHALLKSMIEPIADTEEASIPICRIKVPINGIPAAYLEMDLLAKLYASGKTEIVLYNSHEIGFETKNGQIRYINENDHDINSILQASAKTVLGVNMGIETAGFRLADLELDGGVKALVRSTLHLYDEYGDYRSVSSEIPYSGLNELADGNPDVLVCGDLSLNWLLDLIINTSKTQMNKLGFSRSFSILDEGDQIFGNLHHLENGHFVEKCTRGKQTAILNMNEVKSDRIVLDSYAEVISRQGSYTIRVKSLPSGYSRDDLIYSSEDPGIAAVNNGLITAVSPGSVKIIVETKDGKYRSYVNILVSTQ